MHARQKELIGLLNKKSLVKIISGIDNFNPDQVGRIVRAASIAKAGAVDVVAEKEIVWLARQLTELPVFASSVDPQKLADAIKHGADAVEIGNFDALYKRGFYITADEVVKLSRDTLKLIPSGTPLSVTIPGHLSLVAQIQLAQQLESIGVTMLQTEGVCRVVSMDRKVGAMDADEKAKLTIENTKTLCRAVSIPIMTASGINSDNVIDAFMSGASAVGIGSAVNLLETETGMTEVLNSIMDKVSLMEQQARSEMVS